MSATTDEGKPQLRHWVAALAIITAAAVVVGGTIYLAWPYLPRLWEHVSTTPRQITVCDKYQHDDTYFVRTDDGHELIVGDLKDHGQLKGAEAAYKDFRIGQAYAVSVRMIPFIDWDRRIESIDYSLVPPVPQPCPG